LFIDNLLTLLERSGFMYYYESILKAVVICKNHDQLINYTDLLAKVTVILSFSSI